jgi:hypothetical protein
MELYLFGHRRNVGKDTTAEIIKNCCNNMVYIYHFADAVKYVSNLHFSHLGLKDADYYKVNYSEKDLPLPNSKITPRDIWITIGNGFRKIDPDIWIKIVEEKYIKSHLDEDCLVLIPDLRYPNELFREYNSKAVKVVRDNVERYDDPADTSLEGYDAWDIIVNNNGTIDDLKNTVIELFKLGRNCGI